MPDKAGDLKVSSSPVAEPTAADKAVAANFAEPDRAKAATAITLYMSYRRTLMAMGARDADVSASALAVHHMEEM